MRVSSVTPFLIPGAARPDAWCAQKPWLFVRVETDEGTVGWGEVYTLTGRESAQVALVHALAARVVGKPIANIREFIDDTYRGFGEQRIGIDVYAAASGIELALWDALGRSLNTPVHALLGGACSDRVPAYANLFSERPLSLDALTDKARSYVDAGFQTLKFYPFWHVETDGDGVRRVEALRNAIGPDIGLAIDLSRHLSPHRARNICGRLDPFDLAWVEDPIDASNVAALRDLSNQITQPLMVGETRAGVGDFVTLLQSRAVAMINPDIAVCGGMLVMRDIAALATANEITFSLHNYNSMTIGLAASIHCAAGVPRVGPVEFFPELADAIDAVCPDRPHPVDGWFEMPTDPGWGVTFDEAKMSEFRVG